MRFLHGQWRERKLGLTRWKILGPGRMLFNDAVPLAQRPYRRRQRLIPSGRLALNS